MSPHSRGRECGLTGLRVRSLGAETAHSCEEDCRAYHLNIEKR